MPYMLVMMVVLIISWAMMLNIAKLLTDRMIMQNAADNAALSVAVYKARVLNTLGYLNYLIACTLSDGEAGLAEAKLKGGEPYGVLNYSGGGFFETAYTLCLPIVMPAVVSIMHVSDSQQEVASLLDTQHGFHCSGVDNFWFPEECGSDIARVRYAVFMLRLAEESFYGIFPANAALFAEKAATKNCEGYEFKIQKGNILFSPGSFSLGLYQNRNGIVYCNTKSVCVSIPPNALLPLGSHSHAFWASPAIQVPKSDNTSWMYADRDVFSKNCKITVWLRKKIEKKDFIFSNWMRLDDAEINVFSSASVYNKDGPMFPVERRGYPSDSISPVFKEYLKAIKHGGWYAHLAPVKNIDFFGISIPDPIQH